MSSLRNSPIRQPKDLALSLLPEKKILLVEKLQKRFSFPLHDLGFSYSPAEKKIVLIKSKDKKKAFFCLSSVLLAQVFLGVLFSYRRQLNLVGIGYQAHLEKEKNEDILVLKIGFSHLVRIRVPLFLEVSCPKPRVLILKGMNLQRVNNFAQCVRRCRMPSSYKEKGVYFFGEKTKLKQGKKT